MTIGEIIQALSTVVAIVLAIIAIRKSGAEKKKITAEGLHEDASAAEIYQKLAVDTALEKTQTIATMKANIDMLAGIINNQNDKIKALTETVATEQTARRDLEATVVRLNNDLAEARKELADEREERQTALAELSNLKAWYEVLKAWTLRWRDKMIAAGIEPMPTIEK